MPVLPALEETPADAPPERFVAKVADEGGDVYMAPVLEALRAALARAKRPAGDASTDAPQGASEVERTEARP